MAEKTISIKAIKEEMTSMIFRLDLWSFAQDQINLVNHYDAAIIKVSKIYSIAEIVDTKQNYPEQTV